LRGQSDLIVAVIVFSVLLLVIVPLAQTLYVRMYNAKPAIEESAVGGAVDIAKMYVEQSLNITAVVNGAELLVMMSNRGSTSVNVNSVITSVTCDGVQNLISPMEFKDVTLSPGRTYGGVVNLTRYLTHCTARNVKVTGVYVITYQGNVISANVYSQKELEELMKTQVVTKAVTQAPTILPAKVSNNEYIWDPNIILLKGFKLGTLDSITNPTKVIWSDSTTILNSEGMAGRDNYIWKLRTNLTDVSVIINNQVARNVYLGYDPRDPSKYVIMITSDSSITIGSITYCGGTQGSRVKIYGFKNTTSQGIIWVSGDSNRFGRNGMWIQKPSQDVADYVFLNKTNSGIVSLTGVADRVEVYCREKETSGETGYAPYILFMNNKPVDGVMSLLFTTIDRLPGNNYSVNEGSDRKSLQDRSTKPLVLVYLGDDLEIRNDNVSSVAILLNYAFHDNEGDDFGGVSVDKPVMIVGVVDEGGNVVSYRSYTFRELTRYKDTYPPTAQIQSSVVFIPLPPPETGVKKFYVFIALQDPYSWNTGNYLDDLDLTLYIDSLAVLLYS